MLAILEFRLCLQTFRYICTLVSLKTRIIRGTLHRFDIEEMGEGNRGHTNV